MLEIKLLRKEDIECVSKFIAKLNNIEESHIGYCGQDSEEIANSMINDISEVNYTESFIAAYEDNQLVGVIGFDGDLNDKCAEIWGPFIMDNYWDVVHIMWEEMYKLLPGDIHSLRMFPNKKKQKCSKNG